MNALEVSVVVVAGSRMDLRPGSDGPGIMAFFIVAALVVACVFLYRSMRKQLRKINFEQPSPPRDPAPGGSAGSEPT